MNQIQLQKEPIEISVIQDELRAENPAIGALVTFVGLMRDMNDGDSVATMTLEHYPGMTEKALEGIVREARQRWDLLGVRVVHRVGELQPLDPIVVVSVASAHRGEAFRACEFLIDYLKTRAPFWKKERTPEGERWVDARHSDTEAEKRWSNDFPGDESPR
jgi:molybdopterin synthase catalytic subunit